MIYSVLEMYTTKLKFLLERCLVYLYKFPEKFNVLWREKWVAAAGEVIKKFEDVVIHKVKTEGYDGKEATDEGSVQWSFSGALLYCVTVITTIGESERGSKKESKLHSLQPRLHTHIMAEEAYKRREMNCICWFKGMEGFIFALQ